MQLKAIVCPRPIKQNSLQLTAPSSTQEKEKNKKIKKKLRRILRCLGITSLPFLEYLSSKQVLLLSIWISKRVGVFFPTNIMYLWIRRAENDPY